ENKEQSDSVRAPKENKADHTIKAPEAKPGWLVELRGYTYNENGRTFIIDGLIENIARLGGVKEEAAAGAGAEAKDKTAADAKGSKDPVKGRISHVFLYRFVPVPATSEFTLAATGELSNIAGGGGGGRSAAGGSMMGGANDMMKSMASAMQKSGMGGM